MIGMHGWLDGWLCRRFSAWFDHGIWNEPTACPRRTLKVRLPTCVALAKSRSSSRPVISCTPCNTRSRPPPPRLLLLPPTEGESGEDGRCDAAAVASPAAAWARPAAIAGEEGVEAGDDCCTCCCTCCCPARPPRCRPPLPSAVEGRGEEEEEAAAAAAAAAFCCWGEATEGECGVEAVPAPPRGLATAFLLLVAPRPPPCCCCCCWPLVGVLSAAVAVAAEEAAAAFSSSFAPGVDPAPLFAPPPLAPDAGAGGDAVVVAEEEEEARRRRRPVGLTERSVGASYVLRAASFCVVAGGGIRWVESYAERWGVYPLLPSFLPLSPLPGR